MNQNKSSYLTPFCIRYNKFIIDISSIECGKLNECRLCDVEYKER